MIGRTLPLVTHGLVLVAGCQFAYAEQDCPRTLGTNTQFLEPWPQSDSWYGSDSLAVALPKDGIWPTTVPDALIAVKLFWYSREFQAVAEQGFDDGARLGFKTRLQRLDAGPVDAKISEPTWAGLGGLGENWTILTGIDFPSPGCWEVTGEYREQSLTFVVETIDHEEWTSFREASDRHFDIDQAPIHTRDQVLIHEVNPEVDGLGPEN